MLDARQIERQVALLVAAVVWDDAPGNVVLTGGALVTEDEPANLIQSGGPNGSGFPFALVKHLGGASSGVEPISRVEDARFLVLVVARAKSSTADRHNAAAIIGGARAAANPQGKSEGRGVDELVGQLRKRLDRLTDDSHGFAGWVARTSEIEPVEGLEVVGRPFEIVATNCQSNPGFHPATRFKGTATGSGSFSMTWRLPPTRFDSRRLMLRRLAGSTPPTSSNGTEVALGSSYPAAFVDTPGAGTFSYALFNVLDETGSASDERFSAAATIAGAVVT